MTFMSSNLSPEAESLKNSYRRLMKTHGLKPQKHLGQNFLIDDHVLSDIISAAKLTDKDLVLEIGAGLGILTRALAEKSKKVIALEKDHSLVRVLEKEMADFPNTEIISNDIRSFLKRDCWSPEEYKVIANIPFYLTSYLLLALINLSRPPKMVVLMVQKEVAERVCARPPRSNRLATIYRLRARSQMIRIVPASSFWPRPKVDSAILKIDQIKTDPIDQLLIKLIDAGFHSPRKTLANNLSARLNIDRQFVEKTGLDARIRAEALEISDWLNLFNHFIKLKSAL